MSIISKVFKNSVINDSLWLLLGSFFLRGSIFLLTIAFARSLDIDDFGKLSLIRASSNTLANIVGFFLSTTITKSVAELYKSRQIRTLEKYLGTVKVVKIVIYISIFLILLSTYIFDFRDKLFGFDIHLLEIIFAFVVFILNTSIGATTGVLLGMQKSRIIGKSNIIASLIGIPVMILVLLKLRSLNMALALLSFIYFIQLFYMNISKHRVLKTNNIKDKIIFYKKSFNHIFKTSIPLLLIPVTTNISIYISKITLLKNSNLYELGRFENAYMWLSIILMVLSTVTLPVVGNIAGSKNKTKEFSYLKQSLLLVVGLSVSGCLLVWLCKDLLPKLYANKYDIYIPLLILTASSIPLSIFYLGDKILIAKNHIILCLASYFCYGGFTLLFSYLFAKDAVSLSICFFTSASIAAFVIMAMFLHIRKKVKQTTA